MVSYVLVPSNRRGGSTVCYITLLMYSIGRVDKVLVKASLGKMEKCPPGTVIIVRNFIEPSWTEFLRVPDQ